MRTTTYIFLILFFCIPDINAQNSLTIKVRDSLSQTTLAFSNIILRSNMTGQYTNLDGIATFTTKKPFSLPDSIQCSYLGYQTKYISITEIGPDTLFIDLIPSAIELGKIIIESTYQEMSGKSLVEVAVKNISKNYTSQNKTLHTFYRETIYESDTCIELNESINYITYTKYPQKKYVKKSWKKYWSNDFHYEKQDTNYCGKLLFIGRPQFFKYYNTVDDRCFVQSSRLSNNLSKHQLFSHITEGPLAVSAIDKVKYLADFFDPKLMDRYQYNRKNAVYIDSTLCIAVGFKPKPSIRNVSQPYSKKIGFPLYAGTIYISLEDFVILRFESQWAQDNKVTDYRVFEPWQIYPTSIGITVDYKQNKNGKYRLHKVTSSQFLKANSSIKWFIPEDYICERQLIVLDEVQQFDQNKTLELPDRHNATLRRLKGNYDPNLWQSVSTHPNYPTLSTNAMEALQREMTLENQFKQNAE